MYTFQNSNMEAAANFFAEMILKHGDEILEKIYAEKENSTEKKSA